MNIYLLIVLRAIHVVAGAMWFGAAVFLMFFVKPAVDSIGAAGPQFMQGLMERRRAPIFMVVSSFLTVAAGTVLYINSSGGFNLTWIGTGPGIGFTVGSLAALVAFAIGNIWIGPVSGRIGALGKQIAASGGPPTPEQIASLHAMEATLKRAEATDFTALTISILAMAVARYLIF